MDQRYGKEIRILIKKNNYVFRYRVLIGRGGTGWKWTGGVAERIGREEWRNGWGERTGDLIIAR